MLQDAVGIYAPLPQEITIQLAAVLRARHEELPEGGTVTIDHVVLDPVGEPVSRGSTTYGAEPSPAIYTDSPRRAVLPIAVTVPVAREGLYRIAIGLAVDAPPYVVECRMISFPPLEADATT